MLTYCVTLSLSSFDITFYWNPCMYMYMCSTYIPNFIMIDQLKVSEFFNFVFNWVSNFAILKNMLYKI